MIYCVKIQDYVKQNEKCFYCQYYETKTDSCLNEQQEIEEIGHA